jgi:hypothetical protein
VTARTARLQSGNPPHTEDWHPEGAPPWCDAPSCRCRRRALHVPARRLVTTRRAKQRQASLLEVQERIMPVQATHELPNLSAQSRQQSESRRHPRSPSNPLAEEDGLYIPLPYDRSTRARHYKSGAIRLGSRDQRSCEQSRPRCVVRSPPRRHSLRTFAVCVAKGEFSAQK